MPWGSLERAHRLAEQADDVHSLVLALSGLAEALAQDDPEAAIAHAGCRVSSPAIRAVALGVSEGAIRSAVNLVP